MLTSIGLYVLGFLLFVLFNGGEPDLGQELMVLDALNKLED